MMQDTQTRMPSASATAAAHLSTEEQEFAEKLEQSIAAVDRWVTNHNYQGYDPADGNSSYLHVFTCGNLFLQRVLQQIVLRSPWHIRPFLGIRPLDSPQARGYMAWGYAKLYQQTANSV